MDWSNECDKDLLEANAEFLRFCEEVQKRGYKSTYGTNGYSENLGSLGFYINAFTPYYSLWKDGLFPYHHDGKDSTYGFIYALNAVKRYSNDYPFFYDPEYHTDVVIMSYNTSEQVTTNSNHLKMLNDALAWYKQHNITISVVGNPSTFHTYENIVSETGGVFADINGNFSKDLEPLMKNMISSENDGCLVHLSNGTTVKLDANPHLGDWTIDSDGDGIADLNELMEPTIKQVYNRLTKQWEYQEVWSFLSNPIKQDTDGDGLKDMEDLRPTQYDIRVINDTDTQIVFNTGRIWEKANCTAYDYDITYSFICDVGNNGDLQNIDKYAPMTYNQFIECQKIIEQNYKVEFNFYELCFIGLYDNEGSKFYLDGKSENTREKIFQALFGRDSQYFKHCGAGNQQEDWEIVASREEGGFFKGKVLSEADINFSMLPYKTLDFYDCLPALKVAGASIIAIVVVYYATPVVIANMEALKYYCTTFGISNGIGMWYNFGMAGLPKDILSIIQLKLSGVDVGVDEIIQKSYSNVYIFQSSDDYPNQDNWKAMFLPKGSVLYGGAPGQSNFYTDVTTMNKYGTDATKIFNSLQVNKGPHPQFRAGMTKYITNQDTIVLFSKAFANPQYGFGGSPQYYIHNYQQVLDSVETILLTNR